MCTKLANEGPLLYIKNDINYRLRSDHIMNKHKKLESIFIESFTKNAKNVLLAASRGTLVCNQRNLITFS